VQTVDPIKFQEWKDKQNDPKDPLGSAYGMGIFSFAERWAGLMEAGLQTNPGADFPELADRTSHEADHEGITGFMYGAAVQILFKHWAHGERLRQWHNSKYGVSGEKANQTNDGVVNPAVITLG
jgi:hypothetical protein